MNSPPTARARASIPRFESTQRKTGLSSAGVLSSSRGRGWASRNTWIPRTGSIERIWVKKASASDCWASESVRSCGICALSLRVARYRAHGDLDYARLQVAPVPFVEGVFARGDQDGPVHPDTFAVAMPPASPSTRKSSMRLPTIAAKPSFLGMTANGRGSTRTVCAGLGSPQEGQWPHFPSPHFRTTIIG